MFLSLDTSSMVSYDVLAEIIDIYHKNPGSKVIIDTAIEAFVKDGFYIASSLLVKKGIDPEDITVVTGENNVSYFTHTYRIDFPTVAINIFELSYFLYCKQIPSAEKYLYTNVTPRKLSKHFIDFKKNPRFLRKVFHAYMKKHNYIDTSFYSWHNEYAFYSPDQTFLSDLDLMIDNSVDDTIKSLNKPYIPDDIGLPKEWEISDHMVNSGGINLIHETHPYADLVFSSPSMYSDKFSDPYSYKGVSFFTEKTYKNFVYGLPFLNPGIPTSEFALKQYGYVTWDSMFNTKISHKGYRNNILSYFKLIDEIASMPIQDLEDLLNSEKSLDMLNHNKEMFREQRQFYAVLDLLELVWDKF